MKKKKKKKKEKLVADDLKLERKTSANGGFGLLEANDL